MKTHLHPVRPRPGGYALLMVLCMVGVSMVVLSATLSRTLSEARINDTNNRYVTGMNAAEAAAEKVVARMRYDFLNYGLSGITNNLPAYRSTIPLSTESSYWTNYIFSDAQGNDNATYVQCISATNRLSPMQSQFSGLYAWYQLYRVVSNARLTAGRSALVNAVQEDISFNSIPVFQFAIFYNSLLEFSTCATMTVNGRVHANGPIYTGSSAALTINGLVTTTTTLSQPAWAGQSTNWAYPGSFTGGVVTNVPFVMLPLGTNNVHSIIEQPPAAESPVSPLGQQRLFNEAQIVILVSNSAVNVRIQNSVNGAVPGADPSPTILNYTNLNASDLGDKLPFLTLLWVTNGFYDQREGKTNLTTQIDIGKYASWLNTCSKVLSKFPAGSYPTILYVADNRPVNATLMNAVRLTNGIAPPYNGGLGFTVATPDPLYVIGSYNSSSNGVPVNLSSTNTSTAMACSFMCDALTILSTNWSDAKSTLPVANRSTSDTTVNAAILSGIVPSTGSAQSQYSGGVHNLPRLLENWSNSHLWLNSSIVNLYNSQIANSPFLWPGPSGYYYAPTRHFSYDLNFANPNRQPPPGTPNLSVMLRSSWATPPPNNVSFYVTP